VLSALAGSDELWAQGPEVPSSMLLIVMSLVLLLWTFLKFPRHLHILPASVREAAFVVTADKSSQEPKLRWLGWISGTTRIFVQSAALPVVALTLSDAQLTGHFHQSMAVAALLLLPIPFQIATSRLCASPCLPQNERLRSCAMLTILFAASCIYFLGFPGSGEWSIVFSRVLELLVLMIVLAVTVPRSVARLYQRRDGERSAVLLFWLQAYVGRLLGPVVAIALYTSMGYSTLLIVLCAGTAIVCASS